MLVLLECIALIMNANELNVFFYYYYFSDFDPFALDRLQHYLTDVLNNEQEMFRNITRLNRWIVHTIQKFFITYTDESHWQNYYESAVARIREINTDAKLEDRYYLELRLLDNDVRSVIEYIMSIIFDTCRHATGNLEGYYHEGSQGQDGY